MGMTEVKIFAIYSLRISRISIRNICSDITDFPLQLKNNNIEVTIL